MSYKRWQKYETVALENGGYFLGLPRIALVYKSKSLPGPSAI